MAFAGTATVACPLTLDYAAAGIFVDLLDPDLLPIPGTAIAQAIKVSTKAFRAGERRNKVLILITDGEDHEGDVEGAARAAADDAVVIYTVGVGTPAGEPIPLRNSRGEIVGYKEDRERRKVTSRLDESRLESIATTTGGKYFRSTPEGIELRKIYEEVAGMDRSTLSTRLHTAYEERYQYPLAIAILLLAVEAGLSDRRREPAAGRETPKEEAA